MSTGDVVRSQFFVLCVGNLSEPFVPEVAGMSRFSGMAFHTSRWPEFEVELTGRKIGVIGTGSSGVQCIPIVAEQASHLTVFQRTPAFSVPSRNNLIDQEWLSNFKLTYNEFRAKNSAMLGGFSATFPPHDESALAVSQEKRVKIYEKRWDQIGGLLFMQSFNDLLTNEEANKTAADFVRDKIDELVVSPRIAKILKPKGPIGCKRICTDKDYYATYNRSNVSLIDISGSDSIECYDKGIKFGDNAYPLDIIIFATGFDAITGSILKIEIFGKGGISLAEKWREGPAAILGACTADFPNMFTVCGPGNPSVLTNMVATIEHHSDWIADCIEFARSNDYSLIEATESGEREWMNEVNARVAETLFHSCNSWYLGANIPGKPKKFVPYLGFSDYARRCEEVSGNGYPGFRFN